jgi:hypothetical protein
MNSEAPEVSMRQSLLSIAILTGVLCAATAETVPGPFGILNLPADYESHRVTFRQPISHTGETTVAVMEGEGCLRHFWLTIAGIRKDPVQGMRLTLRIYFDGSDEPNVAMPVTPFFGIHQAHDARYLNSPFLQVTERSGFNSYFPMPFRKGMKVTLESHGPEDIMIWFQADYHRYEAGSLSEPLRFHAAYRRVNRAQGYGKPYHLGHGAGQGVIAGLTLGVRAFDRRDAWYHCGGDLLLLDGGTAGAHLLSGIGGEDFFGTAWGQEVFSNGSSGTPYYDESRDAPADQPRVSFAAYRFFDRDPIAFAESFSYDFGSLENDMSSVLYWYQEGAALPVSKLHSMADRLPETLVPDGKYDVPLEPGLVWNVCGPFSCETNAQFDREEFPERGIDWNQTAPADFGQYAEAVQRKLGEPVATRWIRDVGSVFNFVDLTPHFRSRMRTNGGFPVDTSAYAATTIESPSARTARIRIGHDDWFKLWINGDLVYEGGELNGFQTREVNARLRAGANQVLAKVANRDNSNFRAWVFLLDPEP